jgi:hypothetical protein
MEISHFFNGDGTKVRLLPVMAKCSRFPDDKDVSEENAAFWEATPSGEAEVSLAGMADASFVLGSCYYIDMEPGEGPWALDVVSHTASQREITLRLPWDVRPQEASGGSLRQATIKMNIGNQSAWPAFEGPGAGSKWRVTFTSAPG